MEHVFICLCTSGLVNHSRVHRPDVLGQKGEWVILYINPNIDIGLYSSEFLFSLKNSNRAEPPACDGVLVGLKYNVGQCE